MESVEELYTFFQQLIVTASQVPLVILANQGTPAPSGLYGTYNPIPVRAVGHPKKDRTQLVPAVDTSIPGWEDFNEVTVTQMDFMLSCNFFNEGARDASWKLHNANFRFAIQELLYNSGVAWRYCSEVKDLTGLLQASVQPRYQVDVHLYVATEISDTVLRAAGFNLEIIDEDDNIIYDGVN